MPCLVEIGLTYLPKTGSAAGMNTTKWLWGPWAFGRFRKGDRCPHYYFCPSGFLDLPTALKYILHSEFKLLCSFKNQFVSEIKKPNKFLGHDRNGAAVAVVKTSYNRIP